MIGEFYTAVSGDFNSFTSNGTKFNLFTGRPILVTRFGFIVKTAMTGGPMAVRLRKYPSFGNSASATTIATFLSDETQAANDIVYANMAEMVDTPESNFVIKANIQIDVYLPSAVTAGAGGFFIHYRPLAPVGPDMGLSQFQFKKVAT